MDRKLTIYLAGPIFTYGDLLRNTEWSKKIREQIPNVDLYNPLEAAFNGVEGKKKFGD
jgi:nucleoside 2-deoxyribosyltransferase